MKLLRHGLCGKKFHFNLSRAGLHLLLIVIKTFHSWWEVIYQHIYILIFFIFIILRRLNANTVLAMLKCISTWVTWVYQFLYQFLSVISSCFISFIIVFHHFSCQSFLNESGNVSASLYWGQHKSRHQYKCHDFICILHVYLMYFIHI